MKLAELSVRRHVLAFMASAVFVLFGLVAYATFDAVFDD
jgi:HAE1 family hydrophobic/amphiphilic exporter-1